MGKLAISDFLHEQCMKVPPVATADLTGKTVMVIGANTGLGFEASKHFARMNPARLILACRSAKKGEAALEKLREETGYEAAELWIIDLCEFSSVMEFADKFDKDGGRLDILVENAGCTQFTYETTSDGWEKILQVNCLSLELLALRLLPRMIRTAEEHATRPRVVVVTSELHFWAKFDKQVVDGNKIYESLNNKDYCTPSVMAVRYQISKLLNVFFYQGLSDRLAHSPLIVVGVNPGFCLSEFRRSFSGLRAAFVWAFEKALARTTEEGGRQLVYAAVGESEDEGRLRGSYLSAAKVSEASDFALGAEGRALQDILWEEMMGILGKVDPRVQEVAERCLTPPAR
ncbi:hypothetical protein FPV67DRAFT_1605312 [Lyophyllum atratum]|nr:hypothetical protein FPV67DRAFT_1605312 [Lyophyllum atratum]